MRSVLAAAVLAAVGLVTWHTQPVQDWLEDRRNAAEVQAYRAEYRDAIAAVRAIPVPSGMTLCPGSPDFRAGGGLCFESSESVVATTVKFRSVLLKQAGVTDVDAKCVRLPRKLGDHCLIKGHIQNKPLTVSVFGSPSKSTGTEVLGGTGEIASLNADLPLKHGSPIPLP